MFAKKKPITIEYYPVADEYKDAILRWSTDERPIVSSEDGFQILTLEGVMMATKDDVVIKGVAGEVYPCKKEVFEATYEVQYLRED